MLTSNVTFVLNFQADNPPPTGPKIEKKANNDIIGKKKISNYGSEIKNFDIGKNKNDVTWIENKITIKKTTKFGCFDIKQKT